jgi:hypothetical protein
MRRISERLKRVAGIVICEMADGFAMGGVKCI